MNYRLNTYNKNYIMIDIRQLAVLGDTIPLPYKIFKLTYDIYLAWIELSENNNNVITRDIALKRDTPLKKYLTKREYIKKESDIHTYLYDNNSFKEIEFAPKVKTRKRMK